ncbi:DUF2147 domain-containing protein [Zunongwangia sp. F363]|uniref:DUF2147 domain-containing protein n=1 Tax=Autumnicola tepida TaxID=3075595 RepID=A0ABU3CEL5_9FLAO|nr:DUF2147 domain-containing protein [Zunongwangia sp. F363]MDT0644746.1 DUF2147 domain-containing protein [Zunongwangia sp. F363]
MKKTIFLLILMLTGAITFAQKPPTVFGKWENVNDEGKVNSIIEVYEDKGQVFGKITRIMKEEDRDRKCTECPGDLKNEPLEGLVFMRGLEKNDDGYEDGEVIDPKSGKEYKCKIWLDEDNPDKLHVRGYVAFFYKTKTWNRKK